MADEIAPLTDTAPAPEMKVFGHGQQAPSKAEKHLAHSYRHEGKAKAVQAAARAAKALGQDTSELEESAAKHRARAQALRGFAAPKPLLKGSKGGIYFVCGSGRRIYAGKCK